MEFPSPSPKQGRILWACVTALSIAILVTLVGVVFWGFGWVLNRLSSVLLPLAVAGILAYLIDPIVDFFENRHVPRPRAILLVFFLGLMSVLILLGTVVPKLMVETGQLIDQFPEYSKKINLQISEKLATTHWGMRAREVWEGQFGETAREWLTKVAPAVSTWTLTQLTKVASWAGLVVGFALVPVYLFYFLLEKTGISKHWTDYLPIRESRIKQEVVFVLKSINDCMIVFFRGQILVALCDGVLLTIGFMAMGLNYALLLGLGAGLLSVIPYLGIMVSIIPAVLLAAVEFGDWLHPLLVVAVFVVVQMLEGLFISPKIMGDRVGLHPLTIIVAVMVGTTLLGGILGGVLAIPLTAALRVLMFRYVWTDRTSPVPGL
jgi:predicted PurR-regulated permease PerM